MDLKELTPDLKELTPKQIVKSLNNFIIGQSNAKKSVAISLRNRFRRLALGDLAIKNEIYPKNIIMKGPTGVGKTEIARRLANLSNAPFIKVEATKYTEIGYVGRDVEGMVRDLMSEAIKVVKKEFEQKLRKKAEKLAEEKIIDILTTGETNNIDAIATPQNKDATVENIENVNETEIVRNFFKKRLQLKKIEDKEIFIEYETKQNTLPSSLQIMPMPGMDDIEEQIGNFLKKLTPSKKKQRKLPIHEARKIIIEQELEKLLDLEQIHDESKKRVENKGIIFIDEIDKIGKKNGVDVSREGVQRDILPLVEGTNVSTKYGTIKTDHILFIAAGAFHISKISDLIPELQGRFPIRVELDYLKQKDYSEILNKPKNSLLKQYQALLSTENVQLTFHRSSIEEIAKITYTLNEEFENIGARRLQAILEKILEPISFEPELYQDKTVVIDKKFVTEQLSEIIQNQDLSQYIL